MTDPYLMLDQPDRGENAVIEAPNVCICLLTCMRTEMALRTIQGIVDNLSYPLQKLTWYIADDGSPWEHMQAILDKIKQAGQTVYAYHNERFSPPPFCGRGWNRALARGHEAAPILLWLEDDWVLERKLDLRPHVRLLLERGDVGIVSFRTMSVGCQVMTEGHNGIHYLQYMRDTRYAYSGNPLLRHIRFYEYYGGFATDLSPGDVELNYDYQYRVGHGPLIWRPVDIGGWGIFGHIGRERTW